MLKYRIKTAVVVCGLLLAISLCSDVSGQVYSDLWGKEGEKWSTDSRLPDFSYAGYHCGQSDPPILPIAANVKMFGAKGDGVHDDTEAFIEAIEKTKSGAIYIPKGRYKITKILNIRKSGIVLRGAGPDKSILYFPIPLNDIKPNWGHTTSGRPTSNYSWSGGMIQLKGNYQSKKLTNITSDAKRGERSLTVSSAKNLRAPMRVEILINDDKPKSLTRYLYSNDTGDISKFPRSTGSFVVTIKKINGNEIIFDRPLRFDIRAEWTPQIRRFALTVSEAGIENLCFEFPLTAYKGHFTEAGYNAIAISGASDCWVRNIKILNADSGIFVSAMFCTITGVTFESNRKSSRKCTGHHGICLGGSDNLFTNFNFKTCFIHDLTVSKNYMGNVFSNGRGIDINFDHHKRAPYENLFTNIDTGKGTRLWHCGGGAALGKNCGARGTFWNIRAKQPQKCPRKSFGPESMNLVAVETDQPSVKKENGKWFEAIDPKKIKPQNLHEAQLERRLALQD